MDPSWVKVLNWTQLLPSWPLLQNSFVGERWVFVFSEKVPKGEAKPFLDSDSVFFLMVKYIHEKRWNDNTGHVLKLYEFVVVFFFKMELPKHFETFAKGDWPV